ncbi:MAG TPA: hypothetical protein VGF48_21335 [Thermoanaerobaculia bacterium]|jgi:hypothetical protein
MKLERIQCLWVGPRLSVMEQLALTSFVANGHETHLYTYGPVANIPDGVNVRDGNEILPESMIFVYREHNSYSGFSNYFRYRLLLERGGCWADTDLVALRPIAFNDEYVFSSERMRKGDGSAINAGFIKTPAGCDAMRLAWSTCEAKDRTQIKWGETGPALVRHVVETFGLERYVHEPDVFCPIDYPRWETIIDGEAPAIPETAVAVHLWNEMWRRNGRDKDGQHDPRSLYEQLKARYAVPTPDDAVRTGTTPSAESVSA